MIVWKVYSLVLNEFWKKNCENFRVRKTVVTISVKTTTWMQAAFSLFLF